MKFKIGDFVVIASSKYRDLNLVIGKNGVIKNCWDVSPMRIQPEYDVEIEGHHWLVLEEEIGVA
jgi:hypothetical protein